MKLITFSNLKQSLIQLVTLPIALLYSLNSFAVAPPHGDWKTIETENFRIHYIPKYEQIAFASAHELEIVREKVRQQQNRVLQAKADVLIVDPFNDSNGFAIPISYKPMMAFFATPPTSDTVISNSTGWIQLLALHEYVHLVHIGQVDRGSLDQSIGRVWDLYEISNMIENFPRWSTEGYATYLESTMTGRGRLNDNYVESLIRQFAREGALPNYQTLSTGDGSYKSGSMAYLMAVRYINWLVKEYSEEKLEQVWTRLRAVKDRNLDQAFTGVFQDSPKNLYNRFVAEYTYQTLLNDKENSKQQSFETWLDSRNWLFSPALSPDDSMLAVVETNRKRRTRLVVYSTDENSKAKENFEKAQTELLANDPVDVPDAAPSVFTREIKHSLNQRNFAGIRNPRWLNDSTLFFGASTKDLNNEAHQDLFSWNIETGAVRQITEQQNLRRFDIAPSGDFAIAEQTRGGYSQLIRLDIESGKISPISKKTLSSVFDYPRISADGSKLLYLQSELNKNWKLVQRNLSNQSEQTIPMPKDYQFLSYPSWSKSDPNEILFVAGLKGSVDIFKFNTASNRLSQLTHGAHPLMHPITMKNGDLLYLKETSQGPDLVKLTSNRITPISQFSNQNEFELDLAGEHALPPARFDWDNSEFEKQASSYGIGKQNVTLTVGASYSTNGYEISELGLKSSDILNRFGWSINAASGTDVEDINGYNAMVRWKAWPVEILAQSYQITMDTQDQVGNALTFDREKTGANLKLSWPLYFNSSAIEFVGGFHSGSLTQSNSSLNSSAEVEQDFQRLAAGINQRWFMDRNSFGLNQSLSYQYHQNSIDQNGNTTEVTGSDLKATLGLTIGGLGINVTGDQRTRSEENQLELGGMRSSVLQPGYFEDTVFVKELPFLSAIADEYIRYGVNVFPKGAPVRVYYNEYEFGELPTFTTWGASFDMTIDAPITGVDGLIIEGGVSELNPEAGSNEVQGWFGLYYRW